MEGRVTDELIMKYYGEVGKYVQRTNPRAGIFDMSNVTSWEVSNETVRSLARSLPAMVDSSLPRIIVAPAAHLFGTARMFQMLGEETRPELRVCRTLDETYKSLGISAPKYEPLEAID
jgi:glycine cleavage system aminomethyltransferase T